MKELIRFRNEVQRHREMFDTYKNSPDDWKRRKVHHDLDRFLMEHREAVISIMAEHLNAATRPTKPSWWRRRP